MVRAPTGAEPQREWQKSTDETIAGARAKLSRNIADAAWRRGSSMTTAEAISYATGSPAPPAAVTGSNGSGPLTSREKQVALLIADGLTNADIASRLHMAERTADAHVEHIRNKLGLRSRAQIAVWAHERLGTA